MFALRWLALPVSLLMSLSLAASFGVADEDLAEKKVELKKGDRIIFFGDALSPATPPLQPNGQAITSAMGIDSRILKAAEQNGLLVAAHTVSDAAGNLDDARWYVINVSSGTPVLQQQGDISGGAGVYDTFPGIDIDPQGDIGMSYMQSGTAAGQDEPANTPAPERHISANFPCLY